MTKLQTLLQCSDSEKEAIFKTYNITDTDLEEYIDILEEWLKKTNLPKNDDTRHKIRICLFNCKLGLEETKKCLEGYYRIRTIYSDFFDKMMPTSDLYKNVKRLVYTIAMPRLTDDLCRITIFKVNDPKGEMSDGLLYQLLGIMVTEMRIKYGDYFLSNILVIDLHNFELKHLIKYTPTVIQKLVNLMLAIKLRLKGIHFVNTSDVIDRVMLLVKTMLPHKFQDKGSTHRDPESLQEYIRKEYLPKDYGGSQPSIEELYGEWCEELENRVGDFVKLLDAKSLDDIGKAVDDREIFGVGCDGSFRKLAID